MTSILTNTSAMAALGILRGIDASLSREQTRMSGGLRVATAADNAAYWSIATTMRSDGRAVAAVSDALALSSATVDTAYAGLTSAIDVVSEIKSRLVSAAEPGVDRSKIQKEIAGLQGQLKGIAKSASFNGQNWLSANLGLIGPAEVNSVTVSLPTSFARSADGGVSFGTSDVVLDRGTVLFTSVEKKNGVNRLGGLLEWPRPLTVSQKAVPVEVGYTDAAGGSRTESRTVFALNGIGLRLLSTALADRYDIDPNLGLATNASGGIYLKVAADTWVKGSLTQGTVAGPGPDQTGASIEGTTYYLDGDTVPLPFTTTGTDSLYTVSSLDISDRELARQSDFQGITAEDMLREMAAFVDEAERKMVDHAALLGALGSRIDSQSAFLADLGEIAEKGVGRLVDADMNATSARIRALETQRQLAAQGLALANAQPSGLLDLFR